MKCLFSLLAGLWLAGAAPAHAQGKYLTKNGQVSLFSATPIEDNDARHQQVAA